MTQTLQPTNAAATPTAAGSAVQPAALGARRTIAVLAVLLTGQFMAVLDAAIVNVAIPSIRTSLHTSGSALQLIVAGYVIAYAVLLVTGARLGDRFTQRTTFITGLAVFTITSLACGLAWNEFSLIVFRFLQGAGAAAMIPQIMTMIQRNFTGNARAKALSMYSAIISGGMVVGQVAGGLIVNADLFGSSWRGVFLVNVPIGAALLLIAPKVLHTATARFARKLDLAGLTMLTVSVLLIVLPMVLGHEQNWPLWTWIALGASVIGIGLFVAIERAVAARDGEPLFAQRVLRSPGLALTAATLFTIMATFGGWMFVMAIHLQSTLGYTALHAGLLFIPMGVTFALASLNWERIPQRYHAIMIPLGLVVGASTMVMLGAMLRNDADFGPLPLVVFGIQGIGFGLAFSPLMTRTLAKIPMALAADASGILVTSVQLGVVVGIAVFGSVFLGLVGSTTLSAAHALGGTAIAEGVTVLVAAALSARAAR
ncbi:MFS transporter [Nocardia sp. NBC_00565]|uniref:MFS transporter n=1 Tax=Nocardia sp. NBC_00565 TaxID=2975993 RepID=UPI002E816821|nr:MFS transporter [Nocardia sp. NBC_00565]WUC06907.1 MFS transporter [Nocardia sp. NBC_00565]